MIRIVNVDFIIKYTLFSVCTFFNFFVKAQTLDNNLISNPSLDEIELCTDNPFYIANGDVLIDWWLWDREFLGGSATINTGTYINTCHNELMRGVVNSFGSTADFDPITPRSGSGYYFFSPKQTSFVPDYNPSLPASQDTLKSRQFLKNRLKEDLVEDKTYLLLFYQRGVRWKPNYSLRDRVRNNCATPALGVYFSVDSNYINTRASTRADLFSVQPQIEWSDYELDTSKWTLMADCFTAEGGERFMTLGRFNQESESDLDDCQDYLVKNNGDTIFTEGQTERLFVDDFALYDLDAFTFEDHEHCLLDSFFFEDPYEMGFLAVYGDDTLNQGWVAPGPGRYDIDVIIGHCNVNKTFEIDVSPCFTCLASIDPVELCPGEDYFNPRDYVDASFTVPDTLIKACPDTYEFTVLHLHCSDPIGILEIEVLDYATCLDELPLDVQCVGAELKIPEGDHFFLDVGGFPIPDVWSEPVEIPYQFFDDFCNIEVESGTMRVIECENCNIFIPNVFSPNGDGINDYFEISTACDVQSARVQVFDRQGRLITESRQLNRIWDGRQKNPGVYIYRAVIEHTVAEGTQFRTFTGSLTLVR